jgi:oligo-1,6-glucosidase
MYKRLIELRLHSDLKDVLIYGKFELIQEDHPDVFAYRRFDEKYEIIVIANFRDHTVKFDYRHDFYDIVCSNMENGTSEFLPYEFRILKVKGV